MGGNSNPDCTEGSEQASHNIDKRSGQLFPLSLNVWYHMAKVMYEGDDFRRMHRTDMLALEHLVASGKTGIHEISYKDTKIKVEIRKKGMDTVVKRFRAI